MSYGFPIDVINDKVFVIKNGDEEMMEMLLRWLLGQSKELKKYGNEGREVSDVAVHAVKFYKNPTQGTARALQKEFKEALDALIPLLPPEADNPKPSHFPSSNWE
jgi:hypothetical protein